MWVSRGRSAWASAVRGGGSWVGEFAGWGPHVSRRKSLQAIRPGDKLLDLAPVLGVID